jgi:hypothetical protein
MNAEVEIPCPWVRADRASRYRRRVAMLVY